MARLDGKMILWTATLVVLVGFVAALTLLRPPPGFEDQKAESLVRVEPLAPKGREPASINSAVKFDAMSLGGKENLQAVDLKIPCDGVQKTIFTQRVEQLRLKGSACLSETAQIKKSSIQNAANGFVATVFLSPEKAFTTDYISLSNGINRIVIKHQFTNGKVGESLLVLNRPIVETVNLEGRYKQVEGIVAFVATKTFSPFLSANLTVSTFTNDNPVSTRESLYLAGASYVF